MAIGAPSHDGWDRLQQSLGPLLPRAGLVAAGRVELSQASHQVKTLSIEIEGEAASLMNDKRVKEAYLGGG